MREEFSYGIILYSKDNNIVKYLLLKRREGWLDFPKGHIEKGENGYDAALRETFEETGVKLFKNNLDENFEYSIKYEFTYNNEDIIKNVKMFLSEIDYSTEIKISNEHEGYLWLDYNHSMFDLSYNDQKNMLKYANDYINKKEKIKNLNIKYSELVNANNWNLSKNFVPGDGNFNAKIFIVGQAPGKNEDIEKKPFVGRSGKLLNKLLENIGISRKSVYITSVVQFYPPDNRIPDKNEIDLCLPFLKEQIDIIKPEIIVLLGSVASESLASIKKIMENHGKFINNLYFITLHPAAALRNPENLKIMEDDFKKLKEIINQ